MYLIEDPSVTHSQLWISEIIGNLLQTIFFPPKKPNGSSPESSGVLHLNVLVHLQTERCSSCNFCPERLYLIAVVLLAPPEGMVKIHSIKKIEFGNFVKMLGCLSHNLDCTLRSAWRTYTHSCKEDLHWVTPAHPLIFEIQGRNRNAGVGGIETAVWTWIQVGVHSQNSGGVFIYENPPEMKTSSSQKIWQHYQRWCLHRDGACAWAYGERGRRLEMYSSSQRKWPYYYPAG